MEHERAEWYKVLKNNWEELAYGKKNIFFSDKM